MLKRNHSVRLSGSLWNGLAALWLSLAAISPAVGAAAFPADNPKPSEALKQINKLAEAIDRDFENGRINQPEFETKIEGLVKVTAERAAPFRIADWSGDELYALANLYQRAEQFLPASAAYRRYLEVGGKGDKPLNAQASLVRSLIEIEKLDEAAMALETLERSAPLSRSGYISLLVSRIALHKDLAIRYQDQRQFDKAEKQALRGFRLMSQLGPRDEMDPLNRDARDHDQAALAALTAVSLARQGRMVEAMEFKRRAEQFEFLAQPRMLAIFQSELVAANLIHNAAPGIRFEQWLGGPGLKPEDFRGRVLVLNFWAMWSSPCTEIFPRLRELQNKYGSQGLMQVNVTRYFGRSDKEEDLKSPQELKSLGDYAKRYEITSPIAVAKEDDLMNDDRFSVISLPTLVLIDRKGNVRYIRRGTGNWRSLEKQITRLIEEKP